MRHYIIDEENNCERFWNHVSTIAHAGGKGSPLFRFLKSVQIAEEFPLTDESVEILSEIPGWEEGPLVEVVK